MAKTETITVGGSSMEVYLDGPSDTKARPAIVLMYHRDGLDDFTKLVVKTVVDAGYRVATDELARTVH